MYSLMPAHALLCRMPVHETKKLTLCWLTMLITAGVHAAPAVRLTVYGHHTSDSSIKLCPDDDYTLVFHCSVTNSFSFLWSFPPFVTPSVLFSATNNLGEIDLSPVTLILTKQVLTGSGEENVYESQLQVSTVALIAAIDRRDGQPLSLEVTCQASPTVFQKMSIMVSATDPPEILSASMNMNETLMVTWSTNASGIVNIAVVVNNTEAGIERGVVVGREIRNVSINVDTSLPYNVTVIVFDTCQQEFPSKPVPVEKKSISISSSEKKSISIFSSKKKSVSMSSSEMPQVMCTTIFSPESLGPSPSQCVQRDTSREECEKESGGIVVAFSVVVIALMIMMLSLVLVFIIMLYKHHYQPKVSASQQTQLNKVDSKDNTSM